MQSKGLREDFCDENKGMREEGLSLPMGVVFWIHPSVSPEMPLT